MRVRGWEFWIDRGGTFTDCIARAPDGKLHVAKQLSSDDAPVEVVRGLLARETGLAAGAPLPEVAVKLGSTVATNALLERRGAATVFIANEGLGDVLRIGTQARPELFELDIRKPEPLHARVVEVGLRRGSGGEAIGTLDEARLRADLEAARGAGVSSVAIGLMHAYAYPEDELRVAEIARGVGFADVVCSHAVVAELGLLERCETTVVDAYLTPALRAHVERLGAALPGSHLRFMQSSGGLTRAERFRGPNALLSGPSGGAVAAADVARRAGFERAVGFDMGGTSTDVSLVVDGAVERAYSTEVAGIRVKAPTLRIHTVAAGGGSLCRFDGFSLTVGPESAGSLPGPLCYARFGAEGERLARELALTDVNLHLGRVQPDRFPFPVDPAPVRGALAALCADLAAAGFAHDADSLAAGFVEIANANMAQAIAEVSIARGVDPREHVLVGFGGAGGQHVCAIARRLGMPTVLLHPFAGLLSAYGIGIAPVAWDGERDAGRVALGASDDAALGASLRVAWAELEAIGRAALEAEGVPVARQSVECALDLRHAGTDTALTIAGPAPDGPVSAWRAAFEAEHAQRFGYARPEREIEVVTARVRLTEIQPARDRDERSAPDATDPPPPLRQASVHFAEAGRVDTPVFERESLAPGCLLRGPALILEGTGTVVVDPGWDARLDADGVLRLDDRGGAVATVAADVERDPVRLEVFGNRFMSIAEQMGAVLKNTAVSTNIKERLDYSCAVFDAGGGLVANAPHIPVHLGAMGATVRAVCARFPVLAPGDVVVTNDPFSGGSHLPDVTVVTPVFVDAASATPDFFVASRGHHADIGGRTPGSMPPDSRSLAEEGVVLEPFKLVEAGRFDEAGVRARLLGGPYPARNPDDNVADLVAMVAANRAGAGLLVGFVGERGLSRVRATMAELQAASADKVSREIARLSDGAHTFEDQLDDGTPVRVRVEIAGGRMVIDFAGTGAAVELNLNAPPAVVEAATLYVLRSLVAERVPLNGGCLDPVEIRVPPGSLLDPPRGAAVVGGNVETSQRVVDVLLGALGLAAASQGTMNNVTFGNETFGYYETIGGGAGAGPTFDGASGVHTHMTNTHITDPEVFESRYPVRLERFALRIGSGGPGTHRGGDGLVRAYRFLEPVTVTLLTERRSVAPWGLAGGGAAQPGRNLLIRADGDTRELASKCSLVLSEGDVLQIETPGGGGYGPVVE